MVLPSKRKQTALPSQLDRGRNINAATAHAGRYKIRDLVLVAVDHIKPHPRNARTHSKKQVSQIADSIQAVGFASPVLIDEDGVLLAGKGRLEGRSASRAICGSSANIACSATTRAIYLAPDITGEILQGTQRPSLTLNKLTDLAALPWNEQLRLLESVA